MAESKIAYRYRYSSRFGSIYIFLRVVHGHTYQESNI
jgi:hypothetical protein